jgi:hypothetical protein
MHRLAHVCQDTLNLNMGSLGHRPLQQTNVTRLCLRVAPEILSPDSERYIGLGLLSITISNTLGHKFQCIGIKYKENPILRLLTMV